MLTRSQKKALWRGLGMAWPGIWLSGAFLDSVFWVFAFRPCVAEFLWLARLRSAVPALCLLTPPSEFSPELRTPSNPQAFQWLLARFLSRFLWSGRWCMLVGQGCEAVDIYSHHHEKEWVTQLVMNWAYLRDYGGGELFTVTSRY